MVLLLLQVLSTLQMLHLLGKYKLLQLVKWKLLQVLLYLVYKMQTSSNSPLHWKVVQLLYKMQNGSTYRYMETTTIYMFYLLSKMQTDSIYVLQ